MLPLLWADLYRGRSRVSRATRKHFILPLLRCQTDKEAARATDMVKFVVDGGVMYVTTDRALGGIGLHVFASDDTPIWMDVACTLWAVPG